MNGVKIGKSGAQESVLTCSPFDVLHFGGPPELSGHINYNETLTQTALSVSSPLQSMPLLAASL